MNISKFFRPRLSSAIKQKLKAIREKGLKAFTLVELLVVIAIIGILAALIFVSMGSAQASARDGRRQSELSQTKKALQAYYLQNGRYPTTTADGISLEDDSDTNGTFSQTMKASGYMSIVPRDPKYTPDGDFAYKYIATTTDTFILCAKTEVSDGYACIDQTSGGGLAFSDDPPVDFGGWGGGGGGESPTTWIKVLGGIKEDQASSIWQTLDGGYLVGGTTISYGTGITSAAFLTKVDPSGNQIWSKTFGGTGHDYINSIYRTSDGGYIVTGMTHEIMDGDILVMKFDSSGNRTWTKSYAGSAGYSDTAASIQQTSDGGYIIAGSLGVYTRSALNSDFLIMKLDPSGSQVWAKNYDATSNENAASVQQTSDGGYIVVGHTAVDDILAMKFDSSGNRTWTKKMGGSNLDHARFVQQTSDGGYIITGDTDSYGSGNTDILVVKIDSSGNQTWAKTYGGSRADSASSIQQTSDGGYILSGSTRRPDNYVNLVVVKIDSFGNQTWAKIFGGNSYSQSAQSVRQTSDGGYIVGGYTDSYGAGDDDLAILKIDSSGNISGCFPYQNATLYVSSITLLEPSPVLTEYSPVLSGSSISLPESSSAFSEATVCP